MKQLLSLVFLLSFFLISAQEIDLSFGDNGIVPLENSISSLKAIDDGFMVTNWGKISFYTNEGSPNLSLGNNGVIQGPFLGINADIISDAFMIDSKLMVIGCAQGPATRGYDVYARQFDISTGEPIDGTTYSSPDPNEEEYIIPYVGSEVSLFGYSAHSAGGISLAYNTYNPETNTFSELKIGDNDESSSSTPIPYRFMDLPDGRILAQYTRNHTEHLYEIMDDISEVYALNSDAVLPKFENGLMSNFTALDESKLLAVESNKASSLVVLDLNTSSHESLFLDFLPTDFILTCIQAFDATTILLFGVREGEVEIYAMNEQLESKDFDSSEFLNLEEAGNTNISVNTYRAGDYIYATTFSRQTASLFRLKSGFSSVLEEQISDLDVYPSPATDVLNLDGFQLDKNSSYTIFNSNGQEVQKAALITKSIDVSTLQTGVFYITVQANNSMSTKSFVVERN